MNKKRLNTNEVEIYNIGDILECGTAKGLGLLKQILWTEDNIKLYETNNCEGDCNWLPSDVKRVVCRLGDEVVYPGDSKIAPGKYKILGLKKVSDGVINIRALKSGITVGRPVYLNPELIHN